VTVVGPGVDAFAAAFGQAGRAIAARVGRFGAIHRVIRNVRFGRRIRRLVPFLHTGTEGKHRQKVKMKLKPFSSHELPPDKNFMFQSIIISERAFFSNAPARTARPHARAFFAAIF